MSSTSQLVITTTDTPIISPISSSYSSRSESPVSSHSSLVSTPESSLSTTRTRPPAFDTEGSFSVAPTEEENSPEDVTRKIQNLTLNTLKQPDMPKTKIVLLPPSSTSPHYSPSKQYPMYLHKDGQIFGIDTGSQLSPTGRMIPSPTATAYFPTTWTQTLSPTALSPTSLHPHLRPVSQPREYVMSPHPGVYEYQYVQLPSPQHHSPRASTQFLASPHPVTPTRLGPPPLSPTNISSSSSLQLNETSNEINSNSKDGNQKSMKEFKYDNKHTSVNVQRQEVPRDMFSGSEPSATVLGTATPLGVVVPPYPTSSGEVQVGTGLVSQPVLSPKGPPPSLPSYSLNYPSYPVYYDPNSQVTAYGYPVYSTPYTQSTLVSTPPSSTPTTQPIGYLSTDPNLSNGSPRAVYQVPLIGDWGAPIYVPRTRPRVRPGICLFVFHLPPTVTDEELYRLFSQHGKVLSAKVMRNPQTAESKGFGFVNMANQRDAEKAIATLHGYFWKNKYLKVSYKKKRYNNRS